MAVTPEDIERLEGYLQLNREASERGKRPVAPTSIGMESTRLQKPPKISFERTVGGRTEYLVAVPATLILPRGPDVSLGTFAGKVRFEYNRADCDLQRKDVFFDPFVLCQQTGLFLPGSGKGSQRFRGSLVWQPLDLWVFFDGSPAARKIRKDLKALGVSFEIK